MAEQKMFQSWKEQKTTKPKIEDSIPEYLDSGMIRIALDFAEYMREIKMPLRWGGTILTWKANYKGKPICYVRLEAGRSDKRAWSIAVRLYCIDEYEDIIINEGLQDTVLSNLSYCKCYPNKCGNSRKTTVLGKKLKVCWATLSYEVDDPDETTIDRIKWIVELEKKARERDSEIKRV